MLQGNYTPTVKDNRLGIAGYLDEFANFADLQTFYQKYHPAAVGSNFTVEMINGGLNLQDPDLAGETKPDPYAFPLKCNL